MGKLPKKFVERVASNVKRYQRIVAAQQKADVAEADTVTFWSRTFLQGVTVA